MKNKREGKGWSKGLTKETDERIKKNSEAQKGKHNLSEESIRKCIETKRKNNTLKHSEETKKNIKKSIDERKKDGRLAISSKQSSETKKRKFAFGESVVWNKGLTKYTDERVRINGEKLRGKNNGMSRGHTKEAIKKISIANTGNKNSNWKGGISKEEYGLEFNNQLKEQIRKRDNNRCQQCFRHQDELFRKFRSGKMRPEKLSIHHIDFNKKNNSTNNLISLCRVCHTQTNHNRQDWINYFENKVKQLV